MKRYAAACAVFLSAMALPVLAEDSVTVDLYSGGAEGETSHSVTFSGACGEECQRASLTCDSNGAIEAVLIDISGAEAGKSMAGGKSVMLLMVAGKSHEVEISQFSFNEMNVSWDVSARGSSSSDIYDGLAGAKTFVLAVEGRKEKLPVTREVKDWVKLCAK